LGITLESPSSLLIWQSWQNLDFYFGGLSGWLIQGDTSADALLLQPGVSEVFCMIQVGSA